MGWVSYSEDDSDRLDHYSHTGTPAMGNDSSRARSRPRSARRKQPKKPQQTPGRAHEAPVSKDADLARTVKEVKAEVLRLRVYIAALESQQTSLAESMRRLENDNRALTTVLRALTKSSLPNGSQDQKATRNKQKGTARSARPVRVWRGPAARS